MAFLSPLLLAGVALIGIPIALHLRRRRDPVRVTFPALRLLKRNRHRTETQLRLRRWVLLALRCLLLAALAMALSRPLSRPAVEAGAAGPAGVNTEFAVVIDNGPNASYQDRNESRLDVARTLTGVLLDKLAGAESVVLADRSPAGGAASVEPADAAARVARMRVSDAARPLAAAVRDAVARLAQTPAGRREAYVFTDLSAGAWDDDAQSAVSSVLEEHPGVRLRLVDIGVAAPRNISVDAIQMPSERLAAGDPLELTASLDLVGDWREPLAVQLWLDTGAGPEKRDERLVEPADAAAIDFSIAGLEEGFADGYVRVLAGDALPADDVRRFGVEVQRPRRVLIVAPTEAGALFYRAAIDPPVAGPVVSRRYEARVVTYDAWPRTELAGYDAVVLCDPPPSVERRSGWRRLYDLAVGGGGVGLLLGREATLDAFNTPDAQALLPAKLLYRSRARTHLRPTSYAHPAIKPLAPYADAIPWPAFPVYQRWELDEPQAGTTVVARYADGAPAIVDRGVGRGRVVVMTTSVSDPRTRDDRWSELATAEDPWPFLLVAESLTDYLTGAAQTRLRYKAGEPVTVSLPADLESTGYVLERPVGEAILQTIPPGGGDLTVPSATTPGAYRLRSGAELDRRFVVNLDPANGRLGRVDFTTLAERLGAERVELIDSRDKLARSVDLGRVGQEWYGMVLALAAVALLGEQWVGSRFYRESPSEK